MFDRVGDVRTRGQRNGAGVVGVAALWVLGICVSVAEATDTDQAVAAYYPPLMIDTSPDRPGLAIDVLRTAADRLGREIELDFVPFQRAMHVTRTRDDTLMAALFRYSSRELDFQWVAQVHEAKLRFMSIGTPVNTIEEARSLTRIGVESGSTGDRYLSELGFENLERQASPDFTARMLAAGRIDAWMLSETLAKSVWRDLGQTRTLSTGGEIFAVPIFLVAGTAFPETIAALYRQTIEDMRADGTLAAIVATYE